MKNSHVSPYVLLTAAYNEERVIEKTIISVIQQTILPRKWIIISDHSHDATDAIIQSYSTKYPFIEYVRKEATQGSGFESKVFALTMGYKQLTHEAYDLIGILDADVSFAQEYHKEIIERFTRDSTLGIAGGLIWDIDHHGCYKPINTSLNSVSGAVQMFRRTCYEHIGGLIPFELGGEDSAAEIMARSKGYKVQTFPELQVLHNKPMKTGKKHVVLSRFQSGQCNYVLGYHPVFQIASCLLRALEKPVFVGSLFYLAGYVFSFLTRREKKLPKECIAFLHAEQMRRLFSFKRNVTEEQQ